MHSQVLFDTYLLYSYDAIRLEQFSGKCRLRRNGQVIAEGVKYMFAAFAVNAQ